LLLRWPQSRAGKITTSCFPPRSDSQSSGITYSSGRSSRYCDGRAPNTCFHDLRHFHATLVLVLGEHPKVVRERLGHATIGVTMDIYGDFMPQLQRMTAQRVAAAGLNILPRQR